MPFNQEEMEFMHALRDLRRRKEASEMLKARQTRPEFVHEPKKDKTEHQKSRVRRKVRGY